AKADILYESVDWPMLNQFQHQYARNPAIGFMYLDDVRLDSAGGRASFIRSAFLESFLTSPEIHLAAPGVGEPIRLKNHFVMAVTTNDGMLSPDLLNRAFDPLGSQGECPKPRVADRQSEAGVPPVQPGTDRSRIARHDRAVDTLRPAPGPRS